MAAEEKLSVARVFLIRESKVDRDYSVYHTAKERKQIVSNECWIEFIALNNPSLVTMHKYIESTAIIDFRVLHITCLIIRIPLV